MPWCWYDGWYHCCPCLCRCSHWAPALCLSMFLLDVSSPLFLNDDYYDVVWSFSLVMMTSPNSNGSSWWWVIVGDAGPLMLASPFSDGEPWAPDVPGCFFDGRRRGGGSSQHHRWQMGFSCPSLMLRWAGLTLLISFSHFDASKLPCRWLADDDRPLSNNDGIADANADGLINDGKVMPKSMAQEMLAKLMMPLLLRWCQNWCLMLWWSLRCWWPCQFWCCCWMMCSLMKLHDGFPKWMMLLRCLLCTLDEVDVGWMEPPDEPLCLSGDVTQVSRATDGRVVQKMVLGKEILSDDGIDVCHVWSLECGCCNGKWCQSSELTNHVLKVLMIMWWATKRH